MLPLVLALVRVMLVGHHQEQEHQEVWAQELEAWVEWGEWDRARSGEGWDRRCRRRRHGRDRGKDKGRTMR